MRSCLLAFLKMHKQSGGSFFTMQHTHDTCLRPGWPQRHHLISSEAMTQTDITTILEKASAYLPDSLSGEGVRHNFADVLKGQVVVNLFYENSTRTRTSFELAAKKLGATVINFDVATSSVKKGESLEDTIQTLVAMGADAVILRHQSSGIHTQLVRQFGKLISIINAGDGTHDHPTQGLLDALTILRAFGLPFAQTALSGKKIVIAGDILHSRVARSNLHILNRFGADVHVVAPPGLLPAEVELMGCTKHEQLEPALKDADVVMALRMQLERQSEHCVASLKEYTRFYGLTMERFNSLCKPNAFIMHPGPVNRGVELTGELADHPTRSLITTQVQNGVAVRMAVLEHCLIAAGHMIDEKKD